MTSFRISCLFFSLLGVHVSLWTTMSTLETYIHERVNPSPWYPPSLPTIFSILLVSMGLVRIWSMSAWFSFIAYLCTHKLFWTKDFLDNRSLYIVCVLHGMEGVRIPCLCILYSNANILNYVWTLGSFLNSFRAYISLIWYFSFVQLDLWLLALFVKAFLTVLSLCNLWSSI